MEEKHYMERLDLVGWVGTIAMGLGAAAICGAISIDVANHVQIAEIEPVVPPDRAYEELWIGGATSFIFGQRILAYGYRRDKRRSQDG